MPGLLTVISAQPETKYKILAYAWTFFFFWILTQTALVYVILKPVYIVACTRQMYFFADYLFFCNLLKQSI